MKFSTIVAELDDFFWNVQLVPAVDGFDQQSAPKDTCHFPNIAKASGIRFSDMLFFDDEEKNVRKVSWRASVGLSDINSRVNMVQMVAIA